MNQSSSGFAGLVGAIKRSPVMIAASLVVTTAAVLASFTGNVKKIAEVFTRPERVAVAGRWVSDELTNPFDANVRYQVVLDLQAQGDAIVGNLTERRAGGAGTPKGILEGALDGRRLSFHTLEQSLFGSELVSFRNLYQGTVDDETIRFTLQSDRPWGFPVQSFVVRRE